MSKGIEAKNLSAQLQYRAAGNPPSTAPDSAISNAYPGLEMDFRNVWRRIFEEIELHESSNMVVDAAPNAPQPIQDLKNAFRLTHVEDVMVTAEVRGPKQGGGSENVLLIDTTYQDKRMPLEWSNALAGILHKFSGKTVSCTFESLTDSEKTVRVDLKVRVFFDEEQAHGHTVRRAVIAREVAPPGVLTQSLCSPWQNDYRECACFYWAATRPDYVNIQPRSDGTSAGNNWMQRDRTLETPPAYIVDDWMDPRLVNYTDLFRHWDKSLRFIIGGKDEPGPEEK